MRTLLAILALPLASVAQEPKYGCDSPESKQLDFWVGDWELAYVDEGKTKASRNRITRTLDGCAILEEFNGAPGTKLLGRSYSAYDRLTKQWKQTWVDNSGAYLDFTGGIVDGQMAFWREAGQRASASASARCGAT